jgi:hypothetical protein
MPSHKNGPRHRGRGAAGAQVLAGRPDTPQATRQLTLDDRTDGEQLRDDGLAAVSAATVTGWRLAADHAIERLAGTGGTFTAEDVRRLAGDPLGSHPNAMGARLSAAARRGTIVPAGYVQATRPQSRARVLRAWKGAA